MAELTIDRCYWFHTPIGNWLWITRPHAGQRATVYLRDNIYLGELLAGRTSMFFQFQPPIQQAFPITITTAGVATFTQTFRHTDTGAIPTAQHIDDWPHLCWDAKDWTYVKLDSSVWTSSALIHGTSPDLREAGRCVALKFQGTRPLDGWEMLFTPVMQNGVCGPTERYLIEDLRPRVVVDFDHRHDANGRQSLTVIVDLKRLHNIVPTLSWTRKIPQITVQEVCGKAEGNAKGQSVVVFPLNDILTGDVVELRWPQGDPPDIHCRIRLDGIVQESAEAKYPYKFGYRKLDERSGPRSHKTGVDNGSPSSDGRSAGGDLSSIRKQLQRRGAGGLCDDPSAQQLLVHMPWELLDEFLRLIVRPEFDAILAGLGAKNGELSERLKLFVSRPQDFTLLAERPVALSKLTERQAPGSGPISIADLLARSFALALQADGEGAQVLPANLYSALANYLRRCDGVELNRWLEMAPADLEPRHWFIRRAVYDWEKQSEQTCREWTQRLNLLELLPWDELDRALITDETIEPRLAAGDFRTELCRRIKNAINGDDLLQLEGELQQFGDRLISHLRVLVSVYGRIEFGERVREIIGRYAGKKFTAATERAAAPYPADAGAATERLVFADFLAEINELAAPTAASQLPHDQAPNPPIWFKIDECWRGQLVNQSELQEPRLREMAGWLLRLFENGALADGPVALPEAPWPCYERLRAAWSSFQRCLPHYDPTSVLHACGLAVADADQIRAKIADAQAYILGCAGVPLAMLLDHIINDIAGREVHVVFVVQQDHIREVVSGRLTAFLEQACSSRRPEHLAETIAGLRGVALDEFTRWEELPAMLANLAECEAMNSDAREAWIRLFGDAPEALRILLGVSLPLVVALAEQHSLDPVVARIRELSAEGIALCRNKLRHDASDTVLCESSDPSQPINGLSGLAENAFSVSERNSWPPQLFTDEWHRLAHWIRLARAVEELERAN